MNGRLIIIRTIDLGAVSRSSSPSASVLVHQATQLELRPLHNLHFTDVHVLHRVGTVASLLNVLSNGIRDQLGNNLLQVTTGNLKKRSKV